ncbi:hypothetical protein PILCRDRAFT_108113 [Piloderma croceum F 1598]|uniref:Uncharacterized protein n=1 Tax=Piloderma croceum (strain F 1598) TaxID=765440 RepID=A0A0C3BZN9_PILCF|nr:hypothetical protein PILCRDRAFT_108113 [Piloderma croceum F 1598]
MIPRNYRLTLAYDDNSTAVLFSILSFLFAEACPSCFASIADQSLLFYLPGESYRWMLLHDVLSRRSSYHRCRKCPPQLKISGTPSDSL